MLTTRIHDALQELWLECTTSGGEDVQTNYCIVVHPSGGEDVQTNYCKFQHVGWPSAAVQTFFIFHHHGLLKQTAVQVHLFSV